MSTKEETLQDLLDAKAKLEEAIERLQNPTKTIPEDQELRTISESARALLDINGVC